VNSALEVQSYYLKLLENCSIELYLQGVIVV